MRTAIEVADIFRAEGPGYRAAQAGHLSLTQLKVMSAIENCRTAALGGHVDACEDCGHWRIAYNSCRNRHCPKCQGAAARSWLAEREADLLPIGYFHVVFTLPAEVADIAGQNKAIIYDLLFRAASETMMTIAADPKHLGARIGITAVLHTWGSAMTHHPHIHMIVPGGGISLDGRRWISSRPAFLLPVRVLGMLFRRLFLTRLTELHQAGRLAFFGTLAGLADHRLFLRHLAPVRKKRFVVYAKPPFSGPEAVLTYLSRYTHRVAISNRRHFPLQRLPPRWSGAAARDDARAARVHPPLPAPCPATWLPPHPPLRLARQFRTQGQYCARPRTACRGTTTAAACRSAGATRLAATLSVLRRTHDHHRDLRAMDATPRATSRARINREHPVVTRHSLRAPHAAAPPLRRMPPGTPFTQISTNMPDISRGQITILAPPGGKSHPPGSRRFPAPDRFCNYFNRAKVEIPIDRRRSPAGSCLGGFRTPAPCPDARPAMAGVQKPSPNRLQRAHGSYSRNRPTPDINRGHRHARIYAGGAR